MNGTTRTIQRLFVAFAVAITLLGLGSQLADAKTYDAGRPQSKAQEKAACEGGGGAWTTEHGGNVGICTYTDGSQGRCNFRTKHCTLSFLTAPDQPTSTPGNPAVVDASSGSYDAAVATPTPEHVARASGGIQKKSR